MKSAPLLIATLVASAAAACSTSRVAAQSPEAVVYASPERDPEARLALEVVREYAPLVEQVLAIELGRARIFLADGPLDGARAVTRKNFLGTRISVGNDVGAYLRTILVHELVHLGAFRSRWAALPHCLHEGLAYWLQLQLVELQGRSLSLAAPDEALLRTTLTLSEKENREQPGSLERAWAALWVVSKLGLGRLQDLVERTQRARQAKVPLEWIEAALPEPRNEDAQLLDLVQVNYLDAGGKVIASSVGSFSSPWVTRTPEGAVQMSVDLLRVPPYDGPFMLIGTQQTESAPTAEAQPR